MGIVADDAVDHGHHAEPFDHATQLVHGILPTVHSRRPPLVQAEGTPHLATHRTGVVRKTGACREGQWLRLVLDEALTQPRLPPLHGVERVDQIRTRSVPCCVRNGAEVGNREALVGRLAEKQVAERYMDSAGERFQLLHGRLKLAALPFGQFLELPRQIFLRNPGALARPTQKLGIDGDADHGRSPAKLARAAFRTWQHTLAVFSSGVKLETICVEIQHLG